MSLPILKLGKRCVLTLMVYMFVISLPVKSVENVDYIYSLSCKSCNYFEKKGLLNDLLKQYEAQGLEIKYTIVTDIFDSNSVTASAYLQCVTDMEHHAQIRRAVFHYYLKNRHDDIELVIASLLKQLNVDTEAAKKCAQSDKTLEQIAAERKGVAEINIIGVPAFRLNDTQIFYGATGLAKLKSALTSRDNNKQSSTKSG